MTRTRRYANLLLKWRKLIYLNVLVATILSVVLIFVIPEKFTSMGSFIPVPEFESQYMSASAAWRTQLLTFSGIPSSLSTPAEFMSYVLQSRIIKENVIRENDLLTLWKKGTVEEALEKFDKVASVGVTAQGVVVVSATESPPELAQKIASDMLRFLDEYNKTSVMTQGKRTRQFVEGRLAEMRAELSTVEDSLRQFEEEHKLVGLEEEVTAVISMYADLKTQMIAKEMEIQLASESFSEGNPALQNLRLELKSLKDRLKALEEGGSESGYGVGFSTPFSELSGVKLELARLMREVEIKSQLYAFLASQYEQAKILETKDTPTIQIVEEPTVPDRRSWPKRKLIVVAVFVVSLLVGGLFAFYLEQYERFSSSPGFQSLKSTLLSDFRLKRKHGRSS
jgi:uncharacterized protein involved in exopolysaccharide biosynthesis